LEKIMKDDACEARSSSDVRTGVVDGQTFQRRQVTYSMVDGEALFEGDIVLHPRPEAGSGDVAMGVAITGKNFRWPSGVVPFEIDAGMPNPSRITDAIAHWHANTPMVFVPRNGESNFLRFRSGSGCSSSVGMSGGGQSLTLGNGCSRGNAIHEIGHAVGLWHEQSREDRNQFVTVHLENVEEGKAHNFNQHISDGDDIGAYDYGSVMHYGSHAFSENGEPTIVTPDGQAIGQRDGLSAGDVSAVNHMYFPVLPGNLATGVFTLRQRSNLRFVDAHEHAGRDFAVVTRTAQSNATQQWLVRPVGGVYTIRQRSNGRFMDAHEHSGEDFGVVTRTAQNNDTQRWIVTCLGDGEYTLQQLSSKRFLDAHASQNKDFEMVTRPGSDSAPQRWLIRAARDGSFTLRQKSTGRFADAHEIPEKDFALVTRDAQNNSTQEWLFTPQATLCTVQQMSNRRHLDAYKDAAHDFGVVTRPRQGDADQLWLFRPKGGNLFTVQQWSSMRFLDAHENTDKDFALVTRTEQANDTQVWMADRVTL
jgi:hypothetical protein